MSPVREQSEAHYHELVKASELDSMPVTLIAVDTLLKLICVYRDITYTNIVFPLSIVCGIGCLYLLAKL